MKTTGTTNPSCGLVPQGISPKLKAGWLGAILCGGLTLMISTPARADMVTDWNEITLATQAAVAAPTGAPPRFPPSSCALAMVHLAIFDAVNAIHRKYTPYAFDVPAAHGASPDAAVAAAAHAVLVGLYPSRQADLDSAYADSLALIPDGPRKTSGISVGEVAGAVILALRSMDGSNIVLPYTVPPGPGIYQPFPVALFVAWGHVTPFALTSGSQFRAPGPPALTSDKYTADFNEVKSVGALNSVTRTPDQTQAALFWQENLHITFNNVARLAVAAHHTDLRQNARLFALLNVALADTAIADLDTKYTYDFWRPREAIHAADTDGNPDTTADPAWTPLVYIGVHPDYVSMHSAAGAAAAGVLAWFFDTDEFSFSITTSTAPGGVFRSYTGFSQAALEMMNSRVWLGAHFRTACEDGFEQGGQVARYVIEHVLLPIQDSEDQDEDED